MSKRSDQEANFVCASVRPRADFAGKYPLATRLAIVLLWLLGLLSTFLSIKAAVLSDVLGQDAHAYWLAAQGQLEYARAPGQRDAYLYSPAFLAVIRPLGMLSWPLFLTLWVCLESTVLIWLVKPMKTGWAVPIFLLCTPELLVGNIYVLLAGAAVVGMQKPAAWAFPVLTKLTAGVGLLWFAVRGDWRRLLHGVGGLSLIVFVSYALDPTPWHAWIRFLLDHRDGTPDSPANFFLRCGVAVILVVVGARKQWPWLIAPAMVLASPVLVGPIPLTILAAIPRLNRLTGQKVDRRSSPLPDEVKHQARPEGRA